MIKNIPVTLKEHILPFNWNVSKVWDLDSQIKIVNRADFDYLLFLPLWATNKKNGHLFDLKPIDVINNENKWSAQYDRIRKCETIHPMDFLEYQNKYWILDGVHRLANLYNSNEQKLKIRIHPATVVPKIEAH